MNPERIHRLFRAALIVYVLSLVGLIAVYIHASTAQVEVALFLQGPREWARDSPNALRGFVLDAPTGRMFSNARISVEKEGAMLGEGVTAGHGYVQMPLEINGSGSAILTFRAQHPAFDFYQADAEISIVERPENVVWPTLSTRVVPDKGMSTEVKDPVHEGALRVEPMHASRELIRGLPNEIWFRVTGADGQPIDANVEITEIHGTTQNDVKTQYRVNAPGLFLVSLEPVTGLKLKLKATSKDLEGSSEVWFTTVAAQFSLRMQQSVVAPGSPARGLVHSLTRESGILVDTYRNEHWSAASAFRIQDHKAGIEVHAVGESGLHRVQIYESVFGAQNAWDARYIMAAPSVDEAGCHTALNAALDLVKGHRLQPVWIDTLQTQISTMNHRHCENTLEAVLQSIPLRFVEPPTLLNTRSKDEELLKLAIAEEQRAMMVLIVLALLLGFLIILVLVAQGFGARRTQDIALRDASISTESLEIHSGQKMEWVFLAQVIILLGTLILFGAGIILVLGLL